MRICIDLDGIRHNWATVEQYAAPHCKGIAMVLKPEYAVAQLVKCLSNAGARCFSIASLSCLDDLVGIGIDDVELIGLQDTLTAEETVARVKCSTHSMCTTLEAYSKAAIRSTRTHYAWISVDIGEGREGVPLEEMFSFCRMHSRLFHNQFVPRGLFVNLGLHRSNADRCRDNG